MLKLMILARRLPGLTPAEFAERFESMHIPEVDAMVASGRGSPMMLYRRNYVQHGHDLGTVQPGELDFDVVIECGFESREAYEFTRSAASRHPELPQQVADDLARYLDTSNMRYMVVETVSGGGGAPTE